jgi:hypothetical protein
LSVQATSTFRQARIDIFVPQNVLAMPPNVLSPTLNSIVEFDLKVLGADRNAARPSQKSQVKDRRCGDTTLPKNAANTGIGCE